MIQGTISNLREVLNPGGAGSVFQFTSLGQFITSIISLVMVAAALSSFAIFLWGGIMWIMAGGDQENLKEAKSRMVNAVVGMAITVSAYVLWRLVIRFFGLSSVFPEG